MNGYYYNGSHSEQTKGMGVNWLAWKGHKYSHPKVEMKVRPNPLQSMPRDCNEVKLHGTTTSGIYEVDPDGNGKFNVYCDMETDGGGKI